MPSYKLQLELELATKQEAEQLMDAAAPLLTQASPKAVDAILEAAKSNLQAKLSELPLLADSIKAKIAELNQLVLVAESVKDKAEALCRACGEAKACIERDLNTVNQLVGQASELQLVARRLVNDTKECSLEAQAKRDGIDQLIEGTALLLDTFQTYNSVLSNGTITLLKLVHDPAYRGRKFEPVNRWRFVKE